MRLHPGQLSFRVKKKKISRVPLSKEQVRKSGSKNQRSQAKGDVWSCRTLLHVEWPENGPVERNVILFSCK